MNSKITSSGLAAMIALATGKQKQLCEDFVSALFRIVGQELRRGDNVRIRGFGTFKLVDVEARKSVNVSTGEDYEIPGHTKVVFVMAKELAAVVNEPFEAFDTVEISDELPTDTLDGEVEVPEIGMLSESTTEEKEELIPAIEEVPETEEKGVPVTEEEPEPEPEPTPEPIPEPAPEPEPESDSVVDEEIYLYDEPEEPSFWKRYKFVIGFVTGVCASVLIGWVSISLADYLKQEEVGKETLAKSEYTAVPNSEVQQINQDVLNPDSTDLAKTHSVADSIVSDEKDEVPTKASDSPVYDTVTTTRYLTTIAKEHYGNFNLWPIIYEENAAILGHPDRIRPGTKVVVPPLSKYGVDPKDKEQIKAIKQKGNAIYAKYK